MSASAVLLLDLCPERSIHSGHPWPSPQGHPFGLCKKVVGDASLTSVPAHLRAEVVNPMLGYDDIPQLQEVVLKGNKPLCLALHRQHRVVLYASDDAFIDFAVDFDPGWSELEVPPMTMLTIRHEDVRAVENSEFRFIPQERKGTN